MIIISLLMAPLIAMLTALVRGLFLFWPTMIAMGAVHSFVPAVPPLGWAACFWIVTLLGLLIPTAGSVDAD